VAAAAAFNPSETLAKKETATQRRNYPSRIVPSLFGALSTAGT